MNLSQALINPDAPGGSETDLRREIAAILYNVRMGGGQVVRWMVSDVWRGWRCGLDPVDSRDGRLDPGWAIVVRELLQQAQAQHMRVVVTLANMTGDRFDDAPSAPAPGSACGPGGLEPVGMTATQVLLDRTARDQLQRDFAGMTRILTAYPALAAIELFNEPPFAFTATDAYWSAVRQLRAAVLAAGSAAAGVATISGTAAWNPAIVAAARRAGELDRESFVTVHAYQDYARAGPDGLFGLADLVRYLRRLVPGKPIVIAEAGSGAVMTSLAQHRLMLSTLLSLPLRERIGVWLWGNLAAGSKSDLGLDFSTASAAGSDYRPFFFGDREPLYAAPRVLSGTNPTRHKPTTISFSIARQSSSGMDLVRPGAWQLTLDGQTLLGVTSGGVFSQANAAAGSAFGEPPPTIFLSAPKSRPAWARVSHVADGWELMLYQCSKATDDPLPVADLTPDLVLGLATLSHRGDLLACRTSAAVFAGKV